MEILGEGQRIRKQEDETRGLEDEIRGQQKYSREPKEF
jgi:hypothetical protein